ncbi:MAG: hypothetical protein FWF88_09350 [Peptococcaceae bacterium]|nr:hypothetical protein [Peptococcaceae bacterium]
MEMGETAFDPHDMERVGEYMEDLSSDYQKIYRELLEVGSTMGNAWKAPDNIEFVKQLNSCGEALQSMSNRLWTSGGTLKLQKGNYVTNQKNNIEHAKSLPTSYR